VTASLRPRDRFVVRTALSADEVWARLLAHAKVREANDPAPTPSPPTGAPFLLARRSADQLRLRHWAGPADAVSPVVVLDLTQDDRGGTIVSGHFDPRGRQQPLVELPRVRPDARKWALAGLVATVTGAALITPVLLGASVQTIVSVLVLLVLFSVPTALVFVPGLLIWQSEGAKRFVPPLWELIGEVFTPIALPEAGCDAPFRGHALPAAPE
jgi:hypothetical protein